MSQSAYEKGLIRHDRGQYIDKGNYAYDPRHPDFGGGGADPDGIRDSRRAFADCDTEALAFGAGCTVGPGTYLIGSNITLSAAWTLRRGAILKPTSGVTVTISGAFEAGLYQVFDLSLGGTIAFGAGAVKERRAEWFGATSGGDITAAVSAVGGAGALSLPKGAYTLQAIEMTDLGIQGLGQDTSIVSDTVAGEDLVTFVRGASGRFRQARDFLVSLNTDCAAGIKIEYPRFLLENVRLSAATGVAVSDALISLENAYIVTLLNCYCISQEANTVGLRLGADANSIDIIGGEYATKENCIVIDAGFRIHVKTTIEGDNVGVTLGQGLLINGGDAIRIDSYFEHRGITINGGTHITIGDSTFGTGLGAVVINGGSSILIDGARWLTAGQPRNAVTIASGLDHEVSFRQSTQLNNASMFVLSSSIVNGDAVGTNLLPDPYFDRWTSSTAPTDYTITKSSGSVIVQQETTQKQTGASAIRYESNTTPITGARGFDISLTARLAELKGHWATVGCWVYLPIISGSGYTFRVRLVSDVGTTEQSYPIAAFAAIGDTWVYFSHSRYIDPASTTASIEFRSVGTQLGTEYAIVDRITLVRGKLSQNIPVRI